MTAISYGDMGASLRNMRLITQVKQDLDKYSYEVSSGQKQDLGAAVSGDFTPLASIERSLRTLESYDVAIQEANLFATSMQTTFGAISSHVADLSSSLLTSSTNGDATSISVAAQDARTRFDAVVSGLNTRIGDRSLFSGTATSKTALIPAEDMLAELQTAVTGATTAADVETIVDDWFMSAGGGYETLAYQGSDNALSPFSLGENESVRLGITAKDDAIRQTLKGLALASLVDEGVFSSDLNEQASLMRSAGETLMGSQAGMADLQARVGTVEARIEDANLSNSSMTYAFETAKSEIISSDPYKAASLLTQTETQLELVYTLTAHMSRLSLSDYI